MLYTTIDSPLGSLLLCGDSMTLTGLRMLDAGGARPLDPRWQRENGAFDGVRAELEEYFAGTRREFTVPLMLSGTPFEQRVWRALCEIPYGATISYGQLAQEVGRPGAARAVGAANARNPIAVIVPCHRVLGARGALTGFGGGLTRKRLLLDLEAGVLSLGAACG